MKRQKLTNKPKSEKTDTQITKNKKHTTENEKSLQVDGIADRHCLSPATDAVISCCSKFKYVIAALFIPPFLNYVALLQEANQLMPKGALYDVGWGRKMFLRCNGTGSPTVILDAPTGMSSDVWSIIFEDLSKFTRVCMYDRAGLGFSERPSQNQSDDNIRQRGTLFTVEKMVDDLHHLISYSSQQPRPLLLVGAEIGAIVARFYAQIYEGDVSDIVLVNPLTEDLFTYDSNVWTDFWSNHLIASYQGMQLLAAVGLSRLALIVGAIQHPMANSSTELELDTISRMKHFLCNPRHLSSAVDEHFFINETFSQMQTVFMMKSFPRNISVTVISGSKYDQHISNTLNMAWTKGQENLVTRIHPGSERTVVDEADRRLLYEKPSAILEPVKKLVREHRSKSRQFTS